MTDPDAIPSIGSQVGHYQFLREIAKGPFGPLYELRAETDANGLNGLGRLVTLPADLDPEAEQAITEAAWESLELKHDLILCVADVVFGKGWVTLIHDYSEGSLLRSLQRRAQERQSAFPVAVALRVVFDVLKGLEKNRETCDSAGVAWVPGGGGSTSLYLCGDGRTRGLDGQVMAALLRSKQMCESVSMVGFPPPELIEPGREPDERTDVFVAGAVLWELLSGKELSLGSAIAQGLKPRPKVPSLHLSLPKGVAPVSPAVVRAVNAALELDPNGRPQTRAEFRKLLTEGTVIASYEDVINFTDALLHRESTLFRLTMDAEPRLSDQLHGDRPKPAHIEFAIDLAKRAAAAETAQAAKAAQLVQKSSGTGGAAAKSPTQNPTKSAAAVARAATSAGRTIESAAAKTPETKEASTKAAAAANRSAAGPTVGKTFPKQTLMGMGLGPGGASSPIKPSETATTGTQSGAKSTGAHPATPARPSRTSVGGDANSAKDGAAQQSVPPAKVSTLPKPPPKPSSQPPKPDALRFEAARFDSAKADSVAPEPIKRDAAKPATTKPAAAKPEKTLEKKTLLGLTPSVPAGIQLPPIKTDAVAPAGEPVEMAPAVSSELRRFDSDAPTVAVDLKAHAALSAAISQSSSTASESPTATADKKGAQALLSATIEQRKSEINRVLATTAVAAAEPAMGHSAHGYPSPVGSRTSSDELLSMRKRGSVLQLKLSTLILGVVVAIALAVGATLLVLWVVSKDSKAQGSATTGASANAAASKSAASAPVTPAPPPASEPATSASAASAPEASAAPAPTPAAPAPAPTEKSRAAVPEAKPAHQPVQNLAPASGGPVAPKGARRKRGNQYIPNEL